MARLDQATEHAPVDTETGPKTATPGRAAHIGEPRERSKEKPAEQGPTHDDTVPGIAEVSLGVVVAGVAAMAAFAAFAA